VALIIAPWNFPLAILGGMASAALVAGNAIIIKASSQTSIIAYEFITLLTSILRDSLYPPGLVSLLPGDGNTIGEYLVKHKDIRLIAFTGSNQVGKKIQEIAASAVPSKKIIAEMGGKNAIIVDATADLDEAIPGVMSSTFGYAGQKCSACSRLILEESIYEQFIERFKTAILEMKIGDLQDESTYMGPQIDQKAKNSIQSYIDEAKLNHQMIIGDLAVPQDGFFISPYVFLVDDKTSRIAQEEIFGPVLAVFKARDIGHAIKIANSTSYGLTGAIFSRSPDNIKLACDEFETGNLYVNRGSTGAVVSRQAFGGLKNSSVGFKAGGPLYLLQFVQERTITENTMRRGFVAD
jgi:RHH-type proline utilization regulon transcriptional repressor/proline dehydrogenase/delta 1-pyrroline-5-carboxylate dehydrogenase